VAPYSCLIVRIFVNRVPVLQVSDQFVAFHTLGDPT
jgi:hypothetical protein